MKKPAPFNNLMSQMRQRLALMVGRVLINRVDASGPIQLLQVDGLDDEVLDRVEHFQDYGFVSNPPPGSEAVMVSLAGVRSNGAIIAVGNRQFRLVNLAPGESALHDDLGQVVHLTRTGIRIESPLKIEITAPEVTVTANAVVVDANSTTVTGDAVVEGNATVEGDALVKGNVKLGGAGAVKFVMLADGTPSTKVKAL